MDIREVVEVTQVAGDTSANELLEKGWRLLEVRITRHPKQDRDVTIYVLGRPENVQ